jgi:hypothetical protein
LHGSKRRRSANAHDNPRRPRPAAAAEGADAPPDARTKRRQASTRRAERNAELVTTAHELRAALRTMMERYELRVGGQLAELVQRVEGDPAGGIPARPLTTRRAEAMLARLRAARLKPRKGRAKDFARLEAVVEAAHADAADE